jgi:hypothetical protein
MLQYKSEYFRDVFMKELDHRLYNCYRYEIVNGNESVSTIYASQDSTLIYFGERLLMVQRNRRIFAKPNHLFYDYKTGAQLGMVEFPNWQSAFRARCTLRLNSGQVYSFLENRNHKRWFKPSTWKLDCFEMSNSETMITYFGSRINGSIECNKMESLIPISLGFFIIDHEFRSLEESSG